MELLYYHSAKGNFGDDLNPWFWDRMLPGWREAAPEVKLGGVGTILNDGRFPDVANRHYLILGSGAGYGTPPRTDGQARWDIRAVRGPRTAAMLGVPTDRGITDPAVMISDFEEFRNAKGTSRRPLFVPHHRADGRHDWHRVARQAGAEYCSPSRPHMEVIHKIAAAPLVLAESMHAAILADAFRVPWIATSITGYFNAGKWQDWAEGLGLMLTITPFFADIDRIGSLIPKRRASSALSRANAPATDQPESKGDAPVRPISLRQKVRLGIEQMTAARRLTALLKQPPALSEDTALDRVKTRYLEVLDSARRDYGIR